MKATILLAIALSTLGRADEAGDRAAIRRVMSALPDSDRRPALFAADADSAAESRWIDRLVFDAGPWSELPPPTVISDSIRFVTPDVAVVDGRASRGMMYVIPLAAVLRRDSGQWRIVALRVVARTRPAF